MSISRNYVPYFGEYHGVDPGAYYGVAYRQVGVCILTIR